MIKKNRSLLSDINDRDKRMLIILLIVILTFTSYYFIVSPNLAKGVLLKQEYLSVKTELNRIEKMIADLPELRKTESEQKKLLSQKYDAFFYALDEEKILGQLNKMMIGNNFVISSYSVTEQVATPIIIPEDQYTPLSYPLLDLADIVNPDLIPGDLTDKKTVKEDIKKNKKEQDTVAPDSVANSFITIGFTASGYESLRGFLLNLENMKKTVIIQNINIAQALDGSGLQGEVVLGLYSLPKLDDKEASLFEVKPTISKGKINPFN